jgi:hypothetical protein
MSTTAILAALRGLEEAPWADLKGKPLDPRGLAVRFRTYGVRSTKVKVEGTALQGYRREDLWDSWQRYVPSPAPAEAEPPEPPEQGRLDSQPEVPDANPVPEPAGTVPELLPLPEPDSPTLTSDVPQVPQVPDLQDPETGCAVCGQVMDASLIELGYHTHPGCDPWETPPVGGESP